MRRLFLGLSAFALIAGSAPSLAAAPCRDAKGKFIKCPPAPAKPTQCRDAKGKFIKCAPAKPTQCRDAKGKFTKCGTKGAKPV